MLGDIHVVNNIMEIIAKSQWFLATESIEACKRQSRATVNINELQAHWNTFGKTDPLYSILTYKDKEGNKWNVDEFFASGDEEIRHLLAYAHGLGLRIPPNKALDFGCGVGRLTQALCYYFEHVCGVDIAPSMIDLAQEHNRHGENCTYYLNGRDDLELFADDSFSFIYSNITLQHVAPQYSLKYIREFLRILQPNGLLVFQLPESPVVVPEGNLRQVIKTGVPNGFLRIYRKLRYGGIRPIMQMHGVKKELVLTLLKENGGDIVHVKKEPMAESSWSSYIYFVRKA